MRALHPHTTYYNQPPIPHPPFQKISPLLHSPIGLNMRHTLLPSTLICDFRNTHISPRFLQRIDFQKTDFGAEFGAEPGFVDSAVQLVDLFEGEAFGFVDEEPDECDADEAETGWFFWVSFWVYADWDWFGGGEFFLGGLLTCPR